VIVVCGEALVDLLPGQAAASWTAHPGGSPANVAVGLGRLGSAVQLLSRVADDPFGRLLREHLTASQVDVSLLVPADEPTTLAVVALDGQGRAEYAFYVDGAADGGWRAQDLPAELPAGAALHVSGSLALAVESMGDALETLLHRERGRRLLALDPNVRPRLAGDPAALRARLADWLALVDVVKVSSEDLAWLAPGQDLDTVAAGWRERGPVLVVVTRGESGVLATSAAGTIDLPGMPVDLVDTVGAGDAFMAGLLAALEEAGALTRSACAALSREALTTALVFAQRVAAATCARAGADPPWRSELTPSR